MRDLAQSRARSESSTCGSWVVPDNEEGGEEESTTRERKVKVRRGFGEEARGLP